MDINSLFTAAMVVGYVILGMLTIAVIIKIASVYARYKLGKQDPAKIEIKQNVVLAIEQEQGETQIICSKVENLPVEAAKADAVGEEA